MDALDVAVYRALVKDKVMWWGALDPRLSAESIAKRLRVARSTVRARLAGMRHFGLGMASASVRVDDVRAKPRVIEALGLVDGAFGLMDLVGPWMALALLEGSKAELERRRALVQRLPGVDEVSPCYSLRTPVPSRPLTRTDWDVVRALREMPEASLSRVASRVGVSAKTLGKRYGSLMRERAVWFVPRVEYAAAGSVCRFIVFLDEGADADATARAIGKGEDVLSAEDRRDVSPYRGVDVYRVLKSPALMEDEQRAYLAKPGVRACEAIVPRRALLFDGWIKERLNGNLPQELQGGRASTLG